MKKTLTTLFALLLLSAPVAAQHTNSSTAAASNANSKTARRGPIFRANKEQIKQAQALLKQRGHYAGEQTGKLDDPTRDGLRKYQQAEGIKVTGTLNALTLEKMNIPLTDRQKEVWKQIQASQTNTNSR
ncbi:MAG TPA: peptidoglycan-binding domain-containing protein [Pyrinomonadaceae bacterium]|nr:peptidoglycan-binding domain-containing protein [Pyrinomonadaceae bacterium]